ncbi:unnamed protein product [Ambrosiozyma monospora]|uniref:Unnamed protein product n=1 Tax=Ambrosiozyma monospora TaxID=43982 RepID=A0A9W6Z436_AMBMO|nr:unnamed protein product [Ambrosiozyma monospora]
MPKFNKETSKNAHSKKNEKKQARLKRLEKVKKINNQPKKVATSPTQIPINDLSISQRLRHSTCTSSTPIQGTSRNHNQLSHQQQIMRDEAIDAVNEGSRFDSVYHEQLSNDPTFVTSPDDETSTESPEDFDFDRLIKSQISINEKDNSSDHVGHVTRSDI